MKVNLLNFDRTQMREYFVSLNEKPFRGDQMIRWIHQQGETEFSLMTNFNQSLREHLLENTEIKPPKIIQEQQSKDGTVKWLIECDSDAFIETVFIPEKDRGTLCVSSQVGCAMNCVFCATGKMGFKRNLTTAEIIGQLYLVAHKIASPKKITNLVLMGMGEPLLNFNSVLHAIYLMMDDLAYGLSKHRVTLSTVGIVSEIDRLSAATDVALAVSLHAPNDKLRNQLIPINKKYLIADVIAACKRYFKKNSKRKVSFEYVMLKGINDSEKHAKQLIKLLEGVPSKVNLILFNPAENLPFKSSDSSTIQKFQDFLMKAGICTITRRRRGADIQAACGQLVGSSH